jgi:peptide/nickel transport system substrate-binding protein
LPTYASSRITRRRFLGATAAGASAAALIACGGGGGTSSLTLDPAGSREPGAVWFARNDWKLEEETKQAVRGGIYRGSATADQSGHFDAIALMSSQVPFSAHVQEMLMGRNRGPGIDPTSLEAGNPVGALAESWEIAADALTITFTMRQNVKWHPIAPVNARVMDMDDWKTSLEHHLAVGVYRNAIQEILSTDAQFPDARHMVWKLKTPFAPIFDRIWHDKFAFPLQPKELNMDLRLAESTAIGTGYKILDKFQPSITTEYRKWNQYWGGDPFIDRWHAPIVPEYSNRYSQFVNGNIMDFSPTARDVLLLHKDAPMAVIVAGTIPDNSATRMRWGRTSPQQQAWNDPRVRVAARRSIDFRGIAEFLSNKAEFEANGIPVEMNPMTHLPQNLGYWLNPENGELGKISDNYIYSVAEAKKLAAAAGFNNPIPLPYYVALSGGEVPESDGLVMDSLSATGVFKLDVTRVATAQEHNKYRIDGQYDGLIPQSGSSDDADYFVMRDYHSKGRPDGTQAFPDPRIDAWGEAQRQEVDIEKRRQILKDFQILAGELMPAVPGRHLYTNFSFRWPWLHNSAYGEGGSPPNGNPIQGGHLHWLDKDMPNRDKAI